jgi:hypothetical protein
MKQDNSSRKMGLLGFGELGFILISEDMPVATL